MKLLRAWTTLVWISFRRLLWSANTLMVLLPLAGGALFLMYYRRWGSALAERNFDLAMQQFSNYFVITLFTLFLLPICALAYATTSVGGDREDRTLLFLLIRPVPRWLVLLAKYAATLPLVLGLVVGSFYFYCYLSGAIGEAAWRAYLPAVVFMTVAYVSLFHLFAVVFRHSTIGALIYSLFMELLLGNMPGVIKRVAVSYYGRSMMYSAGTEWGLQEPETFEGLPPLSSAWGLLLIALLSLLAAMLIFQRKEYRDLS